jgi:prevent-host-death family protein
MKERRVGIRELKANLSSVLRSVKAGNAVVITDRGRPVGRILPAEISPEETLTEGVRRNLWSWSGRKWRASSPDIKPRRSTAVSDLLLDDRE